MRAARRLGRDQDARAFRGARREGRVTRAHMQPVSAAGPSDPRARRHTPELPLTCTLCDAGAACSRLTAAGGRNAGREGPTTNACTHARATARRITCSPLHGVCTPPRKRAEQRARAREGRETGTLRTRDRATRAPHARAPGWRRAPSAPGVPSVARVIPWRPAAEGANKN
jgi:hypothetical protein